jgi:hypothetical protein
MSGSVEEKILGDPIFIGRYKICGIEIGSYYYEYIRLSGGKTITTFINPAGSKLTPNKSRTMKAAPYENSKYHNTCKMKTTTSDITITEDGIDEVPVVQIDHLAIAHVGPINKEVKIIYDKKLTSDAFTADPAKLMGFIICKYHSLMYRLESDMKFLKKNGYIDTGHIRAGIFTITVINNIIDGLEARFPPATSEFPLPDCITDLNSNFGPINTYLKIYNKLPNSGSPKDNRDIINEIEGLYSSLPKPPPPLLLPRPPPPPPRPRPKSATTSSTVRLKLSPSKSLSTIKDSYLFKPPPPRRPVTASSTRPEPPPRRPVTASSTRPVDPPARPEPPPPRPPSTASARTSRIVPKRLFDIDD